ncbi:MAG: hypothetical protein EOO04_26630, partial [Chitinophagaceae bacterium]
MKKNRFQTLPQVARWSIVVGLIFFLAMTLMRLATYFFFPNQGLELHGVWKALLLGARYDLRIMSVLILLILIPGAFTPLNPFTGKLQKKIWLVVLGVISFLFIFFYTIDFAHFSYLNQRLNASVLNYLADVKISFTMAWESYPILRLLVIVLLIAFLLSRLVSWAYKKIGARPEISSRKHTIISFSVMILVCGFMIFGRFNQYPLRWS